MAYAVIVQLVLLLLNPAEELPAVTLQVFTVAPDG